jgi:hypothetical protein
MIPLDFGGHPSLHRYNALLYRNKQAALMRESEYSQLIREIGTFLKTQAIRQDVRRKK